jgi:hypothetical protein
VSFQKYYADSKANPIETVIEETGLFPGGSFGGDPCKVKLGAFEGIPNI